MPYIVVEDFKLGQDDRRADTTAPPGTLRRLKNAHITRGGEIEKRKAFVSKHTLPANTFGLASYGGALYVFGSASAPTMPSGVTYQRIQHPSGQALSEVLSADTFNGKLYVVGRYADGSIHHFYDGTRVSAWFDGKSRGGFDITSGTAGSAGTSSFQVTSGTVGTAGTSSFRITGGSSSPGVNKVSSVTVGGVNILGTAVDWVTSNTATAAAVAAQITSYASSPEYTASAVGDTVTISTSPATDAENGKTVVVSVGGTVTATTPAAISGGTNPGSVSAITVGGVNILGSAVPWGTSNAATAAAIAAQIASYSSSPEYTASALSDVVTISTTALTSTENAKTVALTLAGTITATTPAAISGGTTPGAVSSIKINGVEILGASVPWGTSNSATATAVAAQISSYTSSPDYTGSAVGASVNVVAAAAGTTANGYAVTVTTVGTITADNARAMSGGADATGSYTPGTAVLTFRQKLYSVSGSFLHYSKIGDPTAWQTSDTGAGFTNMSSQAPGSEELTALTTYYAYLAVFAKRAVQIWKMDPDPEQNTQVQVLRNTGTYASRSVGAFGDGDVIYLTRSGIRALRARDSSNAATQAEIGAPLDRTVIDYAASLTQTVREQAVAVVEPIDNRYLLALGNKVFAYSLFSGSRISAWSEYDLDYQITDFAIVDDRLYSRAGNTIYLYGGDDNATYDASEVVVELPFLDAKSPATHKRFTGIDAAAEGLWTVELSVNPEQPDAFIELCKIWGPTYARAKLGGSARSTHFKLRFTHARPEYARLSSVSIHYEGGVAG